MTWDTVSSGAPSCWWPSLQAPKSQVTGAFKEGSSSEKSCAIFSAAPVILLPLWHSPWGWGASALTTDLCLNYSLKGGGVGDVWEGLGDSEEARGGRGALRAAPLCGFCLWARNPLGCFAHPRCPWHKQKNYGLLFYFLTVPFPQPPLTHTACRPVISVIWSMSPPSCILSFLGCLMFFFIVFLSLFRQPLELCWTGSTIQRKDHWLVLNWFEGISWGCTLYPWDTRTYIFLVCLLCRIPWSFFRSAWPCERADRKSHTKCQLQDLLDSRTLLIIGCRVTWLAPFPRCREHFQDSLCIQPVVTSNKRQVQGGRAGMIWGMSQLQLLVLCD